MGGLRLGIPDHHRNERGFTLQEVLTVIAILGILIAIAIIIWLGLLERWRVEAAADQLAADMRLEHGRATNQLTDWRMVLAPERADENPGGPDYYLVRLTAPYSEPSPYSTGATDEDRIISRTFPANVKVENHKASLNDGGSGWVNLPAPKPDTTRTMEFNSEGSMAFKAGPSGSVCVTVDGNPKLRVVVLSATSRVRIEDRSGELCVPPTP